MNALLLTIAQAAPGLAMLAVFGLIWGALRLRTRDKRKAALMAICALVILANVLIWTF